MIVNCLNCNTSYFVDPLEIGNLGRTVRCMKCSNIWHQQPVLKTSSELGVEDDAIPTNNKSPSAIGNLNESKIIKVKKRSIYFRLFFVFALIVVFIGSLILSRQSIVNKWPQFTAYYSSIGMNVYSSNPSGLEFRNIMREYIFEDGKEILLITGDIWNPTEQNRLIQKVIAELVDNNGYKLQGIIANLISNKIKSGLSTKFEAQLIPSRDAETIVVRFASEK